MFKLSIPTAISAALALSAGSAAAQPAPDLFTHTAANSAVYYPANPPKLEQSQFFWGGRHYCWYEGWHGPGWYWCGYGWRSGFGWGGGYGWHGWSGGYRGYGHGGYGYGHGWYGHGGYGGYGHGGYSHGGGGYHH